MININEAIKNLKIEYGQNAKSIIANNLGLIEQGGKFRCPDGFAHKNGDRDPSMSWDPNRLQFYCFGCGKRIDIYSHFKDHLNYTNNEIFGDIKLVQQKRDEFAEEIKKVEVINQECINYCKARGLNEKTIAKFKLGTYKNEIAFPYFKYETVISCKLRKPLKNPGNPKMSSVKGSKPFLFGLQNIDLDNKELIICEGEFDAMILYQCGFTNTVSIGAGANSIKIIFEQAKDILAKFNNIIIVSDNDEAGLKMDKEAVAILGNKAKLIDKKLYKLNDINDEYYKFGQEKIEKLINYARFKIEGRRDLDVRPYIGLSDNNGRYIPTGLESIDNAINDLEPRRVTLVTGRSNGGKTTFIKQVIANAIDKDNKVYLMNGENDSNMLINEIYTTVIGKDSKYYDTIRINRKYFKEPKSDVLFALREWHKNKLFMFNKGESKLKTLDQLIGMLEAEIKYNRYDLIVIDNLMSILSVTSAEKYEQQADFVQRLCDLSKIYNTHIILVLHPNKTYQKGEDMDMEQISGSSDIYNKADNIIAVTREYDEDKVEAGINGYIQVIKNRYYGELVKVETYYDKESGLLLEKNEGELLLYNFRLQKYLDKIRGILNGKQMAIDKLPKR